MKYAIMNIRTGSALEMNFRSTEQLEEWLEINKDFKSLGKIEKYLPTRHVRMQRWKDKNDMFEGMKRMYTAKNDHAGWGS